MASNRFDAAKTTARRYVSAPERIVRASGRVLVVTEDVERGAFLGYGLRRHGHAVVVVDSIARALLVSDVQRFDVIVTDVTLRDGSGLELLRRLRERLPAVRGVAMREGPVDEALVDRAGFDYLLERPVPVAAITWAVEALLATAAACDAEAPGCR